MAVGGFNGVVTSLTDPVAIGIVLWPAVGKLFGIFSAAWLMDHFTPSTKDDDYSWLNLGGLAMVAGIGFIVSLLVAELSFGAGSPHNEHAKVDILTGSAIAAVIGGTLLSVPNAHDKKLRLQGVVIVKQDVA